MEFAVIVKLTKWSNLTKTESEMKNSKSSIVPIGKPERLLDEFFKVNSGVGS